MAVTEKMTFTRALANAIFLAEEAAETEVKTWRIDMQDTAAKLKELKDLFLEMENEMSHKILNGTQQNKQFDLVAYLRSVANGKTKAAPVNEDDPAWLKQMAQKLNGGKTKEAPAQQGPLFADGRAGLANTLHKGSDFDASLAQAAVKNKSKLWR